MGTRQTFDDGYHPDDDRPSVTIEIDGQPSNQPAPVATSVARSSGPIDRTRLLALTALAGLVGVALIAIGTTRGSSASQAAPSTTTASTVVERVGPTPEPEVPIIDQLPTTPIDMIDNIVIAWVDDRRRLSVQHLSTGEDLGVSRLAKTNLPPLPERIHLIGAENSTWLIDLLEPENSGELSNTVRMVRLGQDLDSYAFISSNPGEDTEFFVGSLWGPSMAGTATAPASAAVLTVARRGIVVASQAAESSVLLGDGLDPLPTRLGRIVAASPSLVAGIFCDDLGRCSGRVAGWDGSNEVEIWADALGSPVVRISPDERYVLAAGGDTWTLYDLESGSRVSWTTAIRANDTLTWSPDSRSVFWIDDTDVLAHSIVTEPRQMSRVRQAGSLGDRLPGSDVALFLLEQ